MIEAETQCEFYQYFANKDIIELEDVAEARKGAMLE